MTDKNNKHVVAMIKKRHVLTLRLGLLRCLIIGMRPSRFHDGLGTCLAGVAQGGLHPETFHTNRNFLAEARTSKSTGHVVLVHRCVSDQIRGLQRPQLR